jgi:hypothetical protein
VAYIIVNTPHEGNNKDDYDNNNDDDDDDDNNNNNNNNNEVDVLSMTQNQTFCLSISTKFW